MRFVVAGLMLAFSLSPFLFAEEKTDWAKHDYSHLVGRGIEVSVYDQSSGDKDISLEGAIKAVAERRLRSAGLYVVDDSMNELKCMFQRMSVKNDTHFIYTIACHFTLCLWCDKSRSPHCDIRIDDTAEFLGIIPKDELRNKLRASTSEIVDEIANQILKYNPDMKKN